ncbi:hypothetical protein HS088_TW08G00192 [Tripterygium wilfordii]|uniref:Uncharacterized protein n=1 Tax=Tripterygium wilfordii TaxID=458696 RepID=A0A7J7DB77_TRIWF|nr:uncharacterized protein LOC120003427 [Tripterygium wilfordii]KAF5743607.1 hypothetical protein HS088_TW08G00192 [Tripterygium wilfordii]
MFGGGRGMGGGAGGSSVLRVVGRAVARAGVSAGSTFQEPLSSSGATSTAAAASRPTNKPNSSNNLTISSSGSSHFSPFSVPLSASSGVPTCWHSFGAGSCSCCDEFEWVSVDGSEDERAFGFVDDFVLGPVPSADEVQYAVSALQQVCDVAPYSQHVRDKYAYNSDRDGTNRIPSFTDSEGRVSSVGSDLDWVEPSPHYYNSRVLQYQGRDRVYDAFHLLQTDPFVQRMVISLSSDKAVWDAVMNNDVVRQLKESYYSDENITQKSSDEPSDDSNPAVNILRWVFDNTKAKVMEVIDNIMKLTNEFFKPANEGNAATGDTDPFQDKLKTSFLLSIVVLLIVVVSRAHGA